MAVRDTSIMPDLQNRRVPVDYVAALVLLARLGVDLHAVDILAAGEYENYRGEIRDQSPVPGEELTTTTRVALEVGYPSAVDQMPYQFFYGLDYKADGGREWERRSREWMAPFDAASIRYHGLVEYHVLRLSLGYFDREQVERQLEVFGLPKPPGDLTERELMLMVRLLPTYNEWAGNASELERVIGAFFGFTCRVVENIPRRYATPERHQYRLGRRSGGLGRRTLLGDSFVEAESACLVVLSELTPEVVQQLLPGKPLRGKLEWFLRLAMPGNVEYEIRLRPAKNGIVLGSKKDTELRPTYLGLASCL